MSYDLLVFAMLAGLGYSLYRRKKMQELLERQMSSGDDLLKR